MPLDRQRCRPLLREFRLRDLFVEELGWDRHAQILEVPLDGQTYTLSAVAEKRGMVAFECAACGRAIPDYSTRRKIQTKVAKSAHEHLIIYVDEGQTEQVWQWVKREPGRPRQCREHRYHVSQDGEALFQKLDAIAFVLEEEADLTLVEVTGRVRAAFDVERVTRRFYDRFKSEHAAFLKFLKGIPDGDMQRWYVSVMLNRLMFIYFIQKKGFLNTDPDYLRNKLAESRRQGKDRFYRDLLCPLFFDGFARKDDDRSAETNRLLGRVPYLNGGIFMRHQIEELHGEAIHIADAAFEKLFDFFDSYQWHLDERLLRRDDEINPDVLGYIFEKYINQKQMGAYYTKEDITDYISQNTVIPHLFDAAKRECKVAFEGESSVWQLLRENADEYIHAAVRRGVIDENGEVIPESVLPDFVLAGMNDPKARMFDRSYNLGEAFIPDADGKNLALPTETWREYVCRRQRCLELRDKLRAGQITEINDLTTYNLNIRQFAQDVIQSAETPDRLLAFWRAIAGRTPQRSNEEPRPGITILDPTCGSGAFLFAALNILEPLYTACLERMEAFVEDSRREERKRWPRLREEMAKVLARMEEHPNQDYFVLKSIIIGNLYGVDIMEEAVEICKLRLFLKLVAQIDDPAKIEPLPDIDFNIQAGNTLVGFATRESVKAAITTAQHGQGKLVYGETQDTMERVEEKAEGVDRLFSHFRQQQTELGGEVTAEDKEALRAALRPLEEELNKYLASEYGVDLRKKKPYAEWLGSHKPFHWFVEFYGIMHRGGFDVIIGNPPYVETPRVAGEYTIKGLQLVATGNLYSLCVERFTDLLIQRGRLGVIVPISSVCTPRMLPLMRLLTAAYRPLYISNFAVRPGKLFIGTDMNLSILLGHKHAGGDLSDRVWATGYTRWQEHARPHLFSGLAYERAALREADSSIPKIGNRRESGLLEKLNSFPSLARYTRSGTAGEVVYCHSGGRYFRKCIREQLSREYKPVRVAPGYGDATICLLSSSLFYWFWIAISDCYHITLRELAALRVPDSVASEPKLEELASTLISDLNEHARVINRQRADGTRQEEVNFDVGQSKPIIDQIDRVLAKHYDFSDEELDFIVNYDIKYRMGREVGDDA